jgi:primary-amine oxidase
MPVKGTKPSVQVAKEYTMLEEITTTPDVVAPAAHPLEPLTEEEMVKAVSIVRASDKLGAQAKFVKVELHEPPKEVVLNFKEGDPVEREAFMVILDNADGATYEGVVSLNQGQIKEFRHIPGVQPTIMVEEVFAFEQLLLDDPSFQEALKKRGITDFSLVTIDPWSAGNYGDEPEQHLRLARGLTWVRSEPGDNNYARPVDGLLALVDLNAMKIVRIEDHQVIPIPPESGNYSRDYIKEFRPDLKPLEITQPEGPSFSVRGHEVKWQKWSFRIGFTQREGLVLYTIGYEDKGRVRPIIYRASLSEMTVPYGDTGLTQNRKNAFDAGEYGLGGMANSLELGCDCLGEIYYFDVALCNAQGEVMKLANAICMHEEDFGLLWKHVDFRTSQTEVRRSRRLVVSFIATVGNYEYGFYWYFYQDGTLEYEVKLTGVVTTAALMPGETTQYGTLLAPQVYAPIHQHFLCIRLDMMVDGLNNSVYEVHSEAAPLGPDNPRANGFYTKRTLLKTEQEAQQVIDPLSARYWQIVNPDSRNRMGEPVAYKLVPGENVLPFASAEASVSRRAGYMSKHLWVTPYQPTEIFAAGDYPNQHPGGDGLPKWTQADRSIEQTNLVVWYTMGAHHVPRLEDWPVMPVNRIGFMLKPVGFFDRNPALDVPPSSATHCH